MDLIREYQLSIMLVLSSICFIILVFLLLTNYLSREKKKSLLFFVFSTAFLLFTDRYAYIYRGQNTPLAFFLAPLFKYLTFFNILNVTYGFSEFIKCIYKENHNDTKLPKAFKIIKLIIIIGHIVLIISQFTNLYYSFDEYNIYHREKYYALCYFFPLVATILQYIVIAPELKNTKKYILIPLILYFILPIIASIIQLFEPGLSLANIIIAGVVIILYSATIYDANMMLEEKKKTEADLRLANEIQMNECPNIFPAFPDRFEFDLYANMTPAKHVGGDFYDYYFIDDNHLVLVIADVSGKGVSAALNMVKVKQLIKGTCLYVKDPAKVLSLVNTSFMDSNKLDMFVTIWLGIIEISTGKLVFVNAGHEDAIIYNCKRGYEVYKSTHSLPIGAMKDAKYKNNEIILKKNDKLFLYTDGVIDSINNKNKRFGIDNLLRLLNMNKNNKTDEIVNLIKKELNNYSKECIQYDDITMLCFEYIDKNKNNNYILLNQKFKADLNEITKVNDFLLSSTNNLLDFKIIKQYYVVIDELFSNIVNYGFVNNLSDNYINVNINIDLENRIIKIIFEDNGIPFNPLEKEDPKINLSLKRRKEGGLGIYIVKNIMDNVSYEYKNNKNILTIEKKY